MGVWCLMVVGMEPYKTKATLTFPSLTLADRFEREWTRFTYEGRDRSSVRENGSVSITVYNVSDARKDWIESWVASNS